MAQQVVPLDSPPDSPSSTRPRLNFWQIWNMSFGFLGIQFGFALQNANTSRIFETLGAVPENLALYWLAAPITGLIVQPIVGYYSDRTWHPRWGRRRPFFAAGALLASLALVIMPNASSLWMAVGTLWIMDASINISMEPFRAFVGDKLPASQRTHGFVFQSFFIGIGAVVASFLPWIFTNWFGVSNTGAEPGAIPDSVKYSFYIGAAALFITVFWTVLSAAEYPPGGAHEVSRRKRIADEHLFKNKSLYGGLALIGAAMIFAAVIYANAWDKELYVLSLALGIFGIAFIMSFYYILQDKGHLGVVHMTRDFVAMPPTMIQLAAVQFFTWFALYAMWIYTTPAVTSHIYQATDPMSAAYNEGANLVSNLFGMYNGIAAAAAFLLPALAGKIGRRVTHLLALLCGGVGLLSIYFIQDTAWLWLSMAGVGIAWASILSMPYAMLTGSLPLEKMGYYMGVFNFFIVIPQIVAGTVLGFLMRNYFGGESIYALVTGGVFMIIAAFLNLQVQDNDKA